MIFRRIAQLIFFIPGAAIGFIIATAVVHLGGGAGAFVALSAGGITTGLGTILFLKSKDEADKSGGIVGGIIWFLIVAIIIVAGILFLAKSGILR